MGQFGRSFPMQWALIQGGLVYSKVELIVAVGQATENELAGNINRTRLVAVGQATEEELALDINLKRKPGIGHGRRPDPSTWSVAITEIDDASDPQNITIPSGGVGDLLIAFLTWYSNSGAITTDGAGGAVWSSESSITMNPNRGSVQSRIATGSDSLVLNYTAGFVAGLDIAAVVVRIPAAQTSITSTTDLTVGSAVGPAAGTTYPNPPLRTNANGQQPIVWMEAVVCIGAVIPTQYQSTGYTQLGKAESSLGANAGSIAVAYRDPFSDSTTENPDNMFFDSRQSEFAAYTIAIPGPLISETETAQTITPVLTEGGITEDVNQASETDLAQAITARKTTTVNQTTETDLAQAITARKTRKTWPEFPTIRASTGGTIAAGSGPFTVSRPASTEPGDLIIYTIQCDLTSSGTFDSIPDSFVALVQFAAGPGELTTVFAGIADVPGAGPGDVFGGVTFAIQGCYQSLAITGHDEQPLSVSCSSVATGSGSTANPPLLNIGTSAPRLWLVVTNAWINTVNGNPSGFTTVREQTATNVEQRISQDTQTGSSDDPGTQTISGGAWHSVTLAVDTQTTVVEADTAQTITARKTVRLGRISDDFNRADGDVGSNWTVFPGTTKSQIVSNQSRSVVDGTFYGQYWSANPFSHDQFIEVDVALGGDYSAVWLYVCTDSGLSTGYEFGWISDGTGAKYTIFGNTPDEITGVGITGTRRMRLETIGTTLRASVNGIVIFEQTGIGTVNGVVGYVQRHTDTGSTTVDNFVAGQVVLYETDTSQPITAIQTGGGQTITVNQATETDTAQGITARKTVAIGQASETDTAQAVTTRKTVHVNEAERTDDFNRADGDPGTNWSPLTGASKPEILNNALEAPLHQVEYFMYWDVDVFADDQVSEVAVDLSDADFNAAGPSVRNSTTQKSVYYGTWHTNSSGTYLIEKFVNGVHTPLVSVTGVGIAGTRVMRLSVIGDDLTLFVDNVQVLSTTDSDLTSGQPGIFLYREFLGGALTADNFRAHYAHIPLVETDTAQAVTARKTVTIGQATETDTSQTITVNPQRRLINITSETDTSQTITARKTRTLGQTIETDTAQRLGVIVGRVTETDIAQGITARKTVTLGQTNETDTAQTITRSGQTIDVNQASETDTSQAITARKTKTLGQTTETDLAQTITSHKTKTINQTVETDISQAITARKIQTINQSTETDTSQTITSRKTKIIYSATKIDDFNRANGTTLGASWVEEGSSLIISSNQLTSNVNSPSAIVNRAWWGESLGSPDHYNQAQMSGSARAASIYIRAASSSSPTTYYETYYAGGGVVDIRKIVSGTPTVLASASSVTFNNGDVMRLEARGNIIRTLINNVVVVSVVNNDITTGNFVGFRIDNNASVIDNFEADVLQVAQAITVSPIRRLVNTTTETDTAQTITARKTVTLGQTTETDLAQTITRSAQTVILGQAVETDLAQAITSRKTKTIGQSSETNTAQTITVNPQRRLINAASETDTAQAITAHKTKTVNQATETDLAQAITVNPQHRLINQASETDLAQTISANNAQEIAVNQAFETDLAQAITVNPISRLVNQIIETDLAQAIEVDPIRRLISQVTETDLAQAIAFASSVQIGQAFETDLAQAITARKTKTIGQTVETDLAQTITAHKTKILGQTFETDLAQAVENDPIRRLINQSAETDTSQSITSRKSVTLGQAFETDLAQTIFVNPQRRLITAAEETDLAQNINANNTIEVEIDQVFETDLAQAITVNPRYRLVNQTVETDASQTITSHKTKTVNQATETDLAQVITARKLKSLGQTFETDIAQAITASKAKAIDQTFETDLAQAIEADPQRRLVNTVVETDLAQPIEVVAASLVNQAFETDLAQAISVSPRRRLVNQTIETDTSQTVTARKTQAINQSIETDFTQTIVHYKTKAINQISETDLAQGITGRKIKAIDQIIETDLAQTVTTRKSITIGQALESDTSQPLNISDSADAIITGTGTITTTHRRELFRTAFISATGTVAPVGRRIVQASTTVSGTATITADKQRIVIKTVDVDGTCDIAATRTRKLGRSTTVVGIGTLTLEQIRVMLRTAIVAGTSDITFTTPNFVKHFRVIPIDITPTTSGGVMSLERSRLRSPHKTIGDTKRRKPG